MTKLIPPLSDLVALIQKRGVYLCRRLVTKPLSVENTQHRLMFLNRQCPGMAAHLSRLCSGTLRSVIARPCHAQCLTGGLYPKGTLLLPDHRHQSFSTLCFSSIPRISETFFWSSTKPSARSARALSRAVSRSSTLTLSANGFLGLGEGPRFRDNPSSSPLSRCLRHCVRFEEYNPSRLSSAPISPRPLQASAARKIRSLYSAVYRRRTGLAITSTSEGDNPNPSIVSIIDSLLAPYSTLNSRRVSVSSILAERDSPPDWCFENSLDGFFYGLNEPQGKPGIMLGVVEGGLLVLLESFRMEVIPHRLRASRTFRSAFSPGIVSTRPARTSSRLRLASVIHI